MKAPILAGFFLVFSLSAFGQITKGRIAAARESDQWPAMLERIKAQPAAARRFSVEELGKLMAAEYQSGREYHSGGAYMESLPQVADDEQLARLVRPYLDSPSFATRETAFGVLSRGRGSATGKIMADRIVAAYHGLPTSPSGNRSREQLLKETESYIQFGDCLLALLASEWPQFREIGTKYLRLVREKYSSSDQRLTELERELERSGIPVPDREAQAVAGPPSESPPTESASRNEGKERLAPGASPSSEPELVAVRKHPKLMWVALLAFLITAALAVRSWIR